MALNNISTEVAGDGSDPVATKLLRRDDKLALAAAKRQAVGTPGYRPLNHITGTHQAYVAGVLSTVSGSNASVIGHPWSSSALIVDIDPGNPNCYPGTGTTLFDLSGNSNNLTLVGTHIGVSGNYISLGSIGGSWASFPPNFMPWIDQSFTVHCWFQTIPNAVGPIFVQQTGSNPEVLSSGWVPAMYVGADNKLHTSLFWHDDTGGSTSTINVNDGNWHLASVTYSGTAGNGVQTTYINGQVNGPALSNLTQVSYSSTYYYFLGSGNTNNWPSDPNNRPIAASFGAFRIHNFAQTASEILAYYNSTQSNYI